MTRNGNTSIVIPTERSDEESQGSTAGKRSLTYVRDDKETTNTSIVIPTERSDEESRKRKAKRDPSHTFRDDKHA